MNTKVTTQSRTRCPRLTPTLIPRSVEVDHCFPRTIPCSYDRKAAMVPGNEGNDAESNYSSVSDLYECNDKTHRKGEAALGLKHAYLQQYSVKLAQSQTLGTDLCATE